MRTVLHRSCTRGLNTVLFLTSRRRRSVNDEIRQRLCRRQGNLNGRECSGSLRSIVEIFSFPAIRQVISDNSCMFHLFSGGKYPYHSWLTGAPLQFSSRYPEDAIPCHPAWSVQHRLCCQAEDLFLFL
jgi:hypothetical protein